MPFIAIKGNERHEVDDDFDVSTGVNIAKNKLKESGFKIYNELAHKQSGEIAEVPEEEMRDALATGQFVSTAERSALKEARPVETAIGEISARRGVDPEYLKSRAAGMGVAPESAGPVKQALAKVSGAAGAATFGLPQFIAKKMGTEEEQLATDELKSIVEESKSTGQKVGETAAAFLAPIPGAGPAKAAQLGLKGRAAVSAGRGAATGGVAGVTESQTGEELEGAFKGALLGSVLDVAGGMVKLPTSAIKKGAQKLKTNLGAKATGARKAFQNQLKKYPGGKDKFVQDALDLGLIKGGDNVEKIAARSGIAVNQLGKKIGDIIGEPLTVNSNDMVNDVLDVAWLKYKQEGKEDQLRILQKEIKNMVKNHGGLQSKGDIMSIEDLQKLRREIDNRINFERKNQTRAEEPLRDLRNALEQRLEDTIEGAGSKLGKEYKDLKDKFKLAATVNRFASDKSEAEGANRLFGLTESIVGTGVGAGTGSLLGGAASAIGLKTLRERGPAITADVINKLQKKFAANPQRFGKFAPILQKASRRGAGAYAATHRMLLEQYPEYKEMVGEDSQSTQQGPGQ